MFPGIPYTEGEKTVNGTNHLTIQQLYKLCVTGVSSLFVYGLVPY